MTSFTRVFTEYGTRPSTAARTNVANVRDRLHLSARVSAVHHTRLSGKSLSRIRLKSLIFTVVFTRAYSFLEKVAPTATPTAPGASTNAALTGTPFGKAPTGYSSTGYASQYDSLSNNPSSVADYSGKGSSSNSYSSSQQTSKTGGSTNAVSGQTSNLNSADLSMYGKSHTSLTKVGYDF